MNRTDKYHVYAGFHLGLQVAESLVGAGLSDRSQEIMTRLEQFRDTASESPADAQILEQFPLTINDEPQATIDHPVIARAAGIVLDWLE